MKNLDVKHYLEIYSSRLNMLENDIIFPTEEMTKFTKDFIQILKSYSMEEEITLKDDAFYDSKANLLIKIPKRKILSTEQYFIDLISTFPSLTETLPNECSDQVKFIMEIFTDYTMHQIEINDQFELQRCLDFQESNVQLMSTELQLVLRKSFCKPLILRNWFDGVNLFKNLMPAKLKRIFSECEDQLNEENNE